MSETQSPAPEPEAMAEDLLSRPLPDGYRADWARHFASEAMAEEAQEIRTVLLFRIGQEWLALPIGIFQEVTEARRVHTLPHRRDELVRGIVNVRGELLVCISLATLLGIEGGEGGDVRARSFPRLVVIGRDSRRVAFAVDEVHGIHRHAAATLLPVPATLGKSGSSYTTGLISWQGKSVGLLDDRRLLDAIDRGIA